MYLINKIKEKLSYFYAFTVLAQGTQIDNPIGQDDFQSLVTAIANWIARIAVPIAVIVIIYAGLKFMTAGGDTSKIAEAKKILWYAILGLAIVFIGGGFVALIQSVLELR